MAQLTTTDGRTVARMIDDLQKEQTQENLKDALADLGYTFSSAGNRHTVKQGSWGASGSLAYVLQKASERHAMKRVEGSRR